MTKILGMIQARIGSSRLPGKVMLPILDKPVIWHIYHRLKQAKKIDQICIACSTNFRDNPIEQFAIKESIPIFRGPEEKILDRLIGAAEKFNANAIVRITADCPFVDPKIVDEIIDVYTSQDDLDFVSNNIRRTFPDGMDVEVISSQFLKKLGVKLYDSQEWFLMHVIENQKCYKCKSYESKNDLSKLRWTLDYQEDYEFVKVVYSELSQLNIFYMEDILDLIRRKPHISEINAMYEADTSTSLYLDYKKNISTHEK